jgi:hypothetical protein
MALRLAVSSSTNKIEEHAVEIEGHEDHDPKSY